MHKDKHKVGAGWGASRGCAQGRAKARRMAGVGGQRVGCREDEVEDEVGVGAMERGWGA